MLGRSVAFSSSSCQRPALGRRYESAAAAQVRLTATQRLVREDVLRRDRPEDWQEVQCLCGEMQGLVLSEIDRHGLPYRKILCGTCGLLRVSPRWTAGRYAQFYEREYRDLYKPVESTKQEFVAAAAAGAGARSIAAFVVDAAKRFGMPSPSTIVEIGAGGGWILANLPSTWTRIGFDVDDDYLAAGRSAMIDLRRGFLDEAISDRCMTSANIVLLSHVVEHFIDPIEQLTRLRRAINPEALLLIEVPGIFRIHRTALDPMRFMQNAHVHTFCAETLVDVCERSGLAVLQVDETARAVCRPLPAVAAREGSRTVTRPKLARSIVGYLRSCEAGTRAGLALRRLPLIGRVCSASFRRLWFPAIGAFYRK